MSKTYVCDWCGKEVKENPNTNCDLDPCKSCISAMLKGKKKLKCFSIKFAKDKNGVWTASSKELRFSSACEDLVKLVKLLPANIEFWFADARRNPKKNSWSLTWKKG